MGRYLVLLVFSCCVAAGASRVLSRTSLAQRPAGAATAETHKPAAEESRLVVVDADLRGHFTVHPFVDGRRTLMLVDTGASLVSLTYEDATAAGYTLRPADFTQRMSTANGVAAAAPIRIAEMRIGGITIRGIEAVVMPPGRLGTSLLGMSFLRRLGGFEVQRGLLRLQG